MNETYMTIAGNLVDDPKRRETRSGHAVANFRVASTPRRFDREKETWVDSTTLFVNVTCWRNLAENAAASLRKGQPVLVTGRFYNRTYEVNETVHTTQEIEATSVGHDLSRGTSVFSRALRSAGSLRIEVDENGVPVDSSDRWIDTDTGEVIAEPDQSYLQVAAPDSTGGIDAPQLETVDLPEYANAG